MPLWLGWTDLPCFLHSEVLLSLFCFPPSDLLRNYRLQAQTFVYPALHLAFRHLLFGRARFWSFSTDPNSAWLRKMGIKQTNKKPIKLWTDSCQLYLISWHKKAQWASYSSLFRALHGYLTGTCRRATCLRKIFWNSLCHSLLSKDGPCLLLYPHSMNPTRRSKCCQKMHLDQQNTGETLETDSVSCCKNMFQEKTE